MNSYSNITDDQALKMLIELFAKECNIEYQYKSWQDNDYFIQLCKEDGGIIPGHLLRYEELNRRIRTKGEVLEKLIQQYQAIPYLESRNGNQRFGYDLHLWGRNCYAVYNAAKGRMITKTYNLIERLFFPMITPNWTE